MWRHLRCFPSWGIKFFHNNLTPKGMIIPTFTVHVLVDLPDHEQIQVLVYGAEEFQFNESSRRIAFNRMETGKLLQSSRTANQRAPVILNPPADVSKSSTETSI